MRDNVYAQFEYARKKRNLKVMEDLYYQNPKDEQIKFGYAKLLIEKEYVNEGKELLFELLGGKNDKYACLELGKAFAGEDNYEEAKKYFSKLSDIGDMYGKLELGVLESHHGNFTEARKIFTELIDWYGDERAKLELARLDHQTGKDKSAREALTELSQTDDGHVAKYSLGLVEKEKGNLDKAKEMFLSLLDKPNADKAKFQLAKISEMIGDVNQARFYLQDLVRSVKAKEAQFELGRLESKVRNYDKAREILETLYNEEQKEEAKLELGILEYMAGNPDIARSHFNYLIKEKDNEYARRLLLLLEVKEGNDLVAIKMIHKYLAEKRDVNLHIILYLSKKYNIFFDNFNYSKINIRYNTKQLIDYDSNEVIKHILTKHCYSSCQSKFDNFVDIRNLFTSIAEQLNEENKITCLHFNEIYIIPYQHAGALGQNYIKVITLPNSKDIITMYPLFDKYEVSDNDDELEIYKYYAEKRLTLK